MIGAATVECPGWMLQKARNMAAQPVRTGIVNAVNTVALASALEARDAGIITPILIGDQDEIAAGADQIGLDITGVEIIAAAGEQDAAAAGAAAAGAGDVAALMKGHLHTDVFMKAVLNREAGLRMGNPLVHVFHITLPGREGSLIISDCALNPAPDVETKKAIIQNCVTLAQAMGIQRPKVALLSATEVASPRIPSTGEAQELTQWAATALPGADVRGPLAFDLAVSPEAVRIKGLSGAVAGVADVIVVPEIVCGNALYKSLVHFSGACAAGVVMGAKCPILLTSRADPPAARLASATLVASLAGGTA